MNMSKKWHKDDVFGMVFSVGPNKSTRPEDYKTDKHDITTMKQNVVAFKGYYIVVAERDEFWGGKDSKPYRSKVLHDPTWRQLFGCAKAQQKKTLDLHHSFFEGAYVSGQEGAVMVLKLSLGS